MITAAVNKAVFTALTEKMDYDDLIEIYTDNSGKINMIQANSANINKLARDCSVIAQESINKIVGEGIEVPLGTLTGSPLLMGQGLHIKVKLSPIGLVNTSFHSEFESAGINQTRHKIYLNLSAEVGVVLPFNEQPISNVTEVLICENILIGNVPDTYLSLDGNNPLNLIPK